MPGRLAFTLLFLAFAVSAQAGIFVWTDDKGQKHFGNHPPASRQFEPVKTQVGYESKPSVATTPSTAVPEKAVGPAQASPSGDQQMCGKAMHWTRIDIPNLREIAGERKQAGKINSDQHEKARQFLDLANRKFTLSTCLASTGPERKFFECLSRGVGIAVCGLMTPQAFQK